METWSSLKQKLKKKHVILKEYLLNIMELDCGDEYISIIKKIFSLSICVDFMKNLSSLPTKEYSK